MLALYSVETLRLELWDLEGLSVLLVCWQNEIFRHTGYLGPIYSSNFNMV